MRSFGGWMSDVWCAQDECISGDRKVTDKTKNDVSLEDSLAVVTNETAVSETEIAEINELIASYSHENEVLSEADVSPSRKTLQGLSSLQDDMDEADEASPQLSDVLKHEELESPSRENPAIDLNAICDDLDQITDLEAEEQKNKAEENASVSADVEASSQDEGVLTQKNRQETVTGMPAVVSEAEHSLEGRSKSELTPAPIPKTSEHGGLTIKPPPSKSSSTSDATKQKLSIKPAAIAKKEEDERKAAEKAAEKAAAEKAAAEKAMREKANLEAVAQAQKEIRETVARVEALKKKLMAQEAALEEDAQFEDDGVCTQIVSVNDLREAPAQQQVSDDKQIPCETKSPDISDNKSRDNANQVRHSSDYAKISHQEKAVRQPSVVEDVECGVEAAEMGTRLNNLTGQRIGKRPDWVDIETITLPDRDRECHKLNQLIEESLKRKRKQLLTITAERGMGKTMFLAQLYGMLSRSRNDIVTITPAYSTSGRPFAAIRNILEQRFYITAVSPDDVHVQLSWPVFSMIPNREKAAKLLKRLESIWEKSKSARTFEYDVAEINIGQQSQPKKDRANPVAFESGVRTLEAEIAPYVSAIRMLFKADLMRNSIVLLLDDIACYDIESIALLASVFETLPDCPLTIVMTMNDVSQMPSSFSSCPCEKYEMSSLSDSDLVCYSRRMLEKMSQSREKLIVPAELCQVVAQHSCGSPMRARNYMTKLFHPDMMLQWNVNLEALKKEPVDEGVRTRLKQRLSQLPPRESAILGIVSVLNAPFTVHTLDAIMAGSEVGPQAGNGKYIRRLYESGFLSISKEPLLNNAVTYIFKHEFERLGISSLIARDVRLKVYASAAQWYALNNLSGNFNETIGDLWRMQAELMLQHEAQVPISPECMLKAQSYYMEASHYYERVAYSYMARAQYVQARRMFKKLLKALPVDNLSRRIQAALDASRVSLRLGNIDEAIRLAKSAAKHARKLSAFSMVAAASIQVAEILLVLENTRHIHKYIAEARKMLNLGMIPSLMLKTFIIEIRNHLLHTRIRRAQAVLEKAERFVDKYDLRMVETLELRRCRADIVAIVGKPFDAIRSYENIIDDAERMRANAIYADTWRVLGTLQFKLEENDKAFRSWNIALGLAQETNDVCLHANLLCDIADGAIMIHALKTARSVCEQSLSLARQIRHSSLIGRCLLNQANMLVIQKDYERADRLIRRVWHIGQKLRMPTLIFSALSLAGQCMSAKQYSHFDLPRADEVFRRIITFYEKRGMMLELVGLLPVFAKHYLDTQQNIQALNAYKQALEVYRAYAMTKSCLYAETQMKQIFGANILDSPRDDLT